MRRVISAVFGRIRLKPLRGEACPAPIKLIKLTDIHRFGKNKRVLPFRITMGFSQRMGFLRCERNINVEKSRNGRKRAETVGLSLFYLRLRVGISVTFCSFLLF